MSALVLHDLIKINKWRNLLAGQWDFDDTFHYMFDSAGIDFSREIVRTVNSSTDFKSLSGGRQQGDEDINSHFRKGKAGDWKEHFTPKVSSAFFERYDWMGEKLGYW